MSNDLRLYQKPVALLGAIGVAYHECMRGRRTGICTDCGRLEHATTETCLCGGDVEPNDSPHEVVESIDPEDQEDLFARWPYRWIGPALIVGSALVAGYLLEIAIRTGDRSLGVAALLIVAIVCAVWE